MIAGLCVKGGRVCRERAFGLNYVKELIRSRNGMIWLVVGEGCGVHGGEGEGIGRAEG